MVTTPGACTPVAPYELVEKMRASIVVLGPLLARHHFARVSLPGGDDFGSRPIDIHLRALSSSAPSSRRSTATSRAAATDSSARGLVLEYPSHTATDNILMAATLAKGTTVIENAAREPEVQDLAELLVAMGAHISGAGTSRIEVEGVDELHPASHRAVADRVEAATFLAAVVIAGGEVHLRGAHAEHMDMYLEKLGTMGVAIEPTASGISARFAGRPQRVDVVDAAVSRVWRPTTSRCS